MFCTEMDSVAARFWTACGTNEIIGFGKRILTRLFYHIRILKVQHLKGEMTVFCLSYCGSQILTVSRILFPTSRYSIEE